jgi:hypothetical protein
MPQPRTRRCSHFLLVLRLLAFWFICQTAAASPELEIDVEEKAFLPPIGASVGCAEKWTDGHLVEDGNRRQPYTCLPETCPRECTIMGRCNDRCKDAWRWIWKANDPQCDLVANFHPQDACSRIAGRRLIFIGDSVTHHTFESIFRLIGVPAPESHGCYHLICPGEGHESAIVCLVRTGNRFLEPVMQQEIPTASGSTTCPFPTVNFHGGPINPIEVKSFLSLVELSQFEPHTEIEVEEQYLGVKIDVNGDATPLELESETAEQGHHPHQQTPLEVPDDHLSPLTDADIIIINDFVWWGNEMYQTLNSCLLDHKLTETDAAQATDDAFLASYGDQMSKMAGLLQSVPARVYYRTAWKPRGSVPGHHLVKKMNSLAKEAYLAHGHSIIDIENLQEWGNQGHADDIHYCMPGPMDVVAYYLFMYIV